MKKLILLLMLIAPIGFAQCPSQILNQPLETKAQLLVFVSFSMPEQSLKLWAEQAAKVNGKLLLRGFLDDSLQKTTEETLRLFKESSAEFLIHPEAFEKFNIDKVPAVVIAKPDDCLEDDCPAPDFDVVYGDASLEDALKSIASHGEHNQAVAEELIKAYRRQHD
jgi:conjugal transfer pilus assembly protein TrbC